MKVKELNAGDWFTDNTHYWIRTEFNGEYYTLNMDNTCMFGSLGTIPENTEVNFVSSHEVVLPQNREKRLCTLRYAPVFEPLYDVNTNDVMVLRTLMMRFIMLLFQQFGSMKLAFGVLSKNPMILYA